MTGEATFWRMEAERHAGERQPWPCEQARWNRLREHIRQERAAQDQLAADHSELGHDWQTERAYGRVEALDDLLVTMDRMKADR